MNKSDTLWIFMTTRAVQTNVIDCYVEAFAFARWEKSTVDN